MNEIGRGGVRLGRSKDAHEFCRDRLPVLESADELVSDFEDP